MCFCCCLHFLHGYLRWILQLHFFLVINTLCLLPDQSCYWNLGKVFYRSNLLRKLLLESLTSLDLWTLLSTVKISAFYVTSFDMEDDLVLDSYWYWFLSSFKTSRSYVLFCIFCFWCRGKRLELLAYFLLTPRDMVFSYLIAAMGLQVIWSFGLAILDTFALARKKTLVSPVLISLFVVGDWVSPSLSLPNGPRKHQNFKIIFVCVCFR